MPEAGQALCGNCEYYRSLRRAFDHTGYLLAQPDRQDTRSTTDKAAIHTAEKENAKVYAKILNAMIA